ncbi:MAG: flavin reductase family protein [Ectothiorhodospiraceae bacterium]|jgi:flavin reductase (DIM6/NTAB) family NADH-FMN oxidoreductase RutF
MDLRALRNALGTFATGVTIVTARGGDGAPVGLTVNSFSSVSMDPPLVLWNLSRQSPSLAAFRDSSHFAVNVLAAEQADVSTRFATPANDRFAGLVWWEGRGGAPLIAGCVSHFECRRYGLHDGGDHLIVLGEVERFTRSERDPLVFVGGRYRRAVPHVEGN